MSSNQPLDSASQQVLTSALESLAQYYLEFTTEKSKEWAADNLYRLVGADVPKLKPLAKGLREVAQYYLEFTAEKSKEWAADNLYRLVGADVPKLKPLARKLREVAQYHLEFTAEKAKEWAADNLYRFIDTDIQTINPQSIKKMLSEKGEQAMSNIFVKVISNPSLSGRIFWYAIRVSSNGTGFLGWAIPDGTFTQGLDQKQEWSDLRIKPGFSASMVIEFAEHYGWTVVNKQALANEP
jgi:hypothetical protein